MTDKERILELLKELDRPLTITDISQQLEIKNTALIQLRLNELINDGKVIAQSIRNSENNIKEYYSINRETPWDDVNKMHAFISKDMATSIENSKELNAKNEELNAKYEELKENYVQIEKKMKNIHADIITIMGVFISIFSLITINVNFIPTVSKYCAYQIIMFFVLINIVTILSISILLAILKEFLK